MFKKLFIIFISAFALNFIWEHLHSTLYVSYQGGAITDLVLFRAALFDAALITLFAYLCFYSPLTREALRLPSRRRGVISLFVFTFSLLFFAVLLETWALLTGRWVYADAMPIIPLLDVGLTPAIQLALTGYITHKALDWFSLTFNTHLVG